MKGHHSSYADGDNQGSYGKQAVDHGLGHGVMTLSDREKRFLPGGGRKSILAKGKKATKGTRIKERSSYGVDKHRMAEIRSYWHNVHMGK